LSSNGTDRDLRQQAIEKIKTHDMLEKFRISAAKRQAEFYKVSHGRFPRVTKQSVEEEAQRLLSEWKARQQRVLSPAKVPEEVPEPVLSESNAKLKGNFECPRCLKKFRDHKKYSGHIASHYSGGGVSHNAAMMAEAGDGRGLERGSRRMSEAEKEDLQYFVNDAYG
jgi:hypothetical protein